MKYLLDLYDNIILDEIMTKMSFAGFAVYISYNFGVSEYLLLVIQYLFIIDFVAGVLSAKKANRFTMSRAWQGIKKIISLYFGILVVG